MAQLALALAYAAISDEATRQLACGVDESLRELVEHARQWPRLAVAPVPQSALAVAAGAAAGSEAHPYHSDDIQLEISDALLPWAPWPLAATSPGAVSGPTQRLRPTSISTALPEKLAVATYVTKATESRGSCPCAHERRRSHVGGNP